MCNSPLTKKPMMSGLYFCRRYPQTSRRRVCNSPLTKKPMMSGLCFCQRFPQTSPMHAESLRLLSSKRGRNHLACIRFSRHRPLSCILRGKAYRRQYSATCQSPFPQHSKQPIRLDDRLQTLSAPRWATLHLGSLRHCLTHSVERTLTERCFRFKEIRLSQLIACIR